MKAPAIILSSPLLLLLIVALLGAGCDTGLEPTAFDESPEITDEGIVIPGQFIVELDPRVVGSDAAAAISELTALEGVDEPSHIYSIVLNGFAATIQHTALARLSRDPRVKRIVPDHAFTDRESGATSMGKKGGKGKGGGSSSPQVIPWNIVRVGGPIDASSIGNKVYVVSNGIDGDHPDLNVVERVVTLGSKKYKRKDWGVGTTMAGVVGAIDNDIDVVGVAKGARLVDVTAVAPGSGLSDFVAGLEFAAGDATAGDVILLGPTPNLGEEGPFLADALVDAADVNVDVSFVIPAGPLNDLSEPQPHPWQSNLLPGDDNIYVVSFITKSDCRHWGSSYGGPVDYAAPGFRVVGGEMILTTKEGGGTVYDGGTPIAAAHVAGLLLVGELGSSGNVTCVDESNGSQTPLYPAQEPIALSMP